MRPIPRISLSVREAGPADLPFLDMLQKMHSHMVGWMPRKQLEGYIERGDVLIAEEDAPGGTGVPPVTTEGGSTPASVVRPPVAHRDTGGTPVPPKPLGYIIARDQYMKRDDVGIIYQLNVLPLRQRSLIGATLIQATFERAAYGCKLFSCWCAQDIQANWFWESIGFVPIAFRTGSRGKQRTHIFWQRRIREGDDGPGTPGGTPYWYPCVTAGGSVREDRIVLPIPPGTHWRDPMPLILPEVQCAPPPPPPGGELPAMLPGGAPVRPRPEHTLPPASETKEDRAKRLQIVRSRSRHLQGIPPGKAAVISGGRLKLVDREDFVPDDEASAPPERTKRRRSPRPSAKNDPKQVAAARDLRDRYLEEINSPGGGRLLPASDAVKYDVSRPRPRPRVTLPAPPPESGPLTIKPMLDAA